MKLQPLFTCSTKFEKLKRDTTCLCFLLLIATICYGQEQMLFSSDRNGNSDIYVMDMESRSLTQITTAKSEEWAPVWINDHEISYLSQNGDTIDRIIRNLKTGTMSLVPHPIQCKLDDKNALYQVNTSRYVYVCDGSVYLNQNNNQSQNLTPNLKGNANYVEWVPTQNKITFTSKHEGSNDIYLMNLTDMAIRKLTHGNANNERGAISPDGKWLVYSSDQFEKGNQDILLKNLETQSIEHLVKSPGFELIARWSKDGQNIYYGSNTDGNWELYEINLTTKQITQLTQNTSFDGDPRIN